MCILIENTRGVQSTPLCSSFIHSHSFQQNKQGAGRLFSYFCKNDNNGGSDRAIYLLPSFYCMFTYELLVIFILWAIVQKSSPQKYLFLVWAWTRNCQRHGAWSGNIVSCCRYFTLYFSRKERGNEGC